MPKIDGKEYPRVENGEILYAPKAKQPDQEEAETKTPAAPKPAASKKTTRKK